MPEPYCAMPYRKMLCDENWNLDIFQAEKRFKKKYLHCRMAVMFSWCEKMATILLFLFSSSLWSCIILYVSSIFSAIIHWPKFPYGLHSFVFFYQFSMRHTHNFHSKYYPTVYFKSLIWHFSNQNLVKIQLKSRFLLVFENKWMNFSNLHK